MLVHQRVAVAWFTTVKSAWNPQKWPPFVQGFVKLSEVEATQRLNDSLEQVLTSPGILGNFQSFIGPVEIVDLPTQNGDFNIF